MKYEIIDKENRFVKINCTTNDFLDGSLDEYIKTALRMKSNKITVEIENVDLAKRR